MALSTRPTIPPSAAATPPRVAPEPSAPDELGREFFGCAQPSSAHPLITREIGGVRVAEQTIAPCSGRILGSRSEPAFATLTYVLGGFEWLYLPQGRRLAKAGDVLARDSQHSLGFEVLEPVHEVSFVFRAEQLGGRLPRDPGSCALHLPRESGLGPMFSSYLGSLVAELDRMPERLHEGAIAMTIELLARVLDLDRGHVAERDPHAFLEQLLDQIERALHDPSLSPENLATANDISLRQLQKVFADRGLKVAEWIRRRRLDRCRELLEEPTQASPHEVALRAGFDDPTNFGRAFRRRYGVSPREYRRLAMSR